MTTREGGTGLGLAIVGKILEEHGGGIELLDNPAGRGGQVRMRVPREHWPEPPARRGPCRHDRREGRRTDGPRDRGDARMSTDILIVDDEADIRDLVAGILDDEGHRTPHGRQLRRGARRHRGAPAAPRLPRHLAAGLPPRRPAGARPDQGRASRPAGRDDLGPRQHRDGGLGHQGAAPTTSSRSRSRPTGWSWSPSARSRPRGCKREVTRPHAALRPGEPHRRRARRRSTSCARPIERVAPTNARILIAGAPGLRQGARGAHPPRACRPARTGPFVRHQRGHDHARDDGGRAVRRRGRRRAGRAGSARSRRRMAARSTSTRSPTCRARRRAASCASSSTRTSSASAARRGCTSTCASSRPRRRDLAGGDRRGPLPRGPVPPPLAWCRSGCRPCPSGARTCPS